MGSWRRSRLPGAKKLNRLAWTMIRGHNNGARPADATVLGGLAEFERELIPQTIEDDRYPFSPRVRVLKDILAKFPPEPAPGGAARAEALRAAKQGAIPETKVTGNNI